jgi:hypothetical protein
LQIMCQCFSWKSNTSSLPYPEACPFSCPRRLEKAEAGEYPNTG